MSLATGMAIGMAVGASHAASTGTVLTAGQLAASAAIGIPVGLAAGIGVAAVMKNPKAMNVVRFGMAAAILSPILAAEDLLRAAGANIPKQGILYNEEGKSIWQIWNESNPVWDGKV